MQHKRELSYLHINDSGYTYIIWFVKYIFDLSFIYRDKWVIMMEWAYKKLSSLIEFDIINFKTYFKSVIFFLKIISFNNIF